ncbi:hypothetical protein J5Y04_13420 [Kitasatospora sp. RG8]|uniref:hypothetical protein n=1 Tax=Kitasatospora sp. RG8 TaxID=2820815 RepID=UPI001AE0DD34|nr:hypothetical protein [Kitasatospora sp. RG8]
MRSILARRWHARHPPQVGGRHRSSPSEAGGGEVLGDDRARPLGGLQKQRVLVGSGEEGLGKVESGLEDVGGVRTVRSPAMAPRGPAHTGGVRVERAGAIVVISTAVAEDGGSDASYSRARATSQQVHGPRIDHLVGQAPPEAWQRLSAGSGAKGERFYDWAAARLPAVWEFDGDEPTRQRRMLARRSIARPDETAYHRVSGPAGDDPDARLGIGGRRGRPTKTSRADRKLQDPGRVEFTRRRSGPSRVAGLWSGTG